MYERHKLDEARYFLNRMRDAEGAHDECAFKNELSAFLSAARSVLQYAREEASAKSGLRWYDAAVASDPCITFMRDERNHNIHEKPVSPARSTSLAISEHLGLEESLTLAVRDYQGRLIAEHHLSSPPPAPEPEAATHVTTRFFFSKWPGPEDVVGLADLYLHCVEAIVADGTNQGLLTI